MLLSFIIVIWSAENAVISCWDISGKQAPTGTAADIGTELLDPSVSFVNG